jgi:hypothetical protein
VKEQENQVDIENPGWEALHAYRLYIYPNNLVVLTNASETEFRAAVTRMGKLAEEGNGKNIEEVLYNMGFFAVAGNYTGVEVDF